MQGRERGPQAPASRSCIESLNGGGPYLADPFGFERTQYGMRVLAQDHRMALYFQEHGRPWEFGDTMWGPWQLGNSVIHSALMSSQGLTPLYHECLS